MEDNIEIYSEIRWLFDGYFSSDPSELRTESDEFDKRTTEEFFTDFLSPIESSIRTKTLENISCSSSFSYNSKNDEYSDRNEYEFESNGENGEKYYLDSDSNPDKDIQDNNNKEFSPTKNQLVTKHRQINDALINLLKKKNKFESHNFIYHIIKLLGYGYYGTVFLAKMREKEENSDDHLVAVKIINFEQIKTDSYHSENHNTTVDIIDQLNDEINILLTMKNHTNVINYIESFYINPHYLAFVTDYISGYTLRDIYKSYGPFSENLICFICEPILKVLNILSNYNYRYKRIHKDIKSNNIMIDYNTCQVKLLDFGVSQILDSVLYHTPKISSGTLQWMSPELIQSKDYDHLTDIWSLGITLLELSTGHIPNIYEIFLPSNNSSNYIDLIHDTTNNERTLEMYIKLLIKENESCCSSNPIKSTTDEQVINQNQIDRQLIQRNNSIINKIKSFSKNYSDFLNNMLIVNPKERPDSYKLLQHPFILSKKKSIKLFNNNFQNIEKELYYFNNSFNIIEFFKQKIIPRIVPNVFNLSNNTIEETLHINDYKKQNKSMEKINFNYIQDNNNEQSNIKFSFSDSETDDNTNINNNS
ncbi:Protein kinase domain protein [Cryptosporidium meleagridis]|uniref:non-specific serine/threonine protein kinase n=1 Tax=Cryptosporidium meleagridis TaxID=93969 RepID=A0A2P4YXD7_9CRYT|nr:Protein kinase domain protein [Cryptosporidium meleagridis]